MHGQAAVLKRRLRSADLGHLGDRDDQLAVGQPGADAGRVHRLGHLPCPPQLGGHLAEAVLQAKLHLLRVSLRFQPQLVLVALTNWQTPWQGPCGFGPAAKAHLLRVPLSLHFQQQQVILVALTDWQQPTVRSPRTSAGSAGRVAASDRTPSSTLILISLRSRPRPSTGTRMSATRHRSPLL